MFQLRFQAQQGIGEEEVQVLLTDLLKGVGLYFDRRNLISIFGMVRKENAAAKTVRKGIVLVGIDDDGAWEADCYFFRRGIGRYRVLQGKMKIIGDHTQDHLSVIMTCQFCIPAIHAAEIGWRRQDSAWMSVSSGMNPWDFMITIICRCLHLLWFRTPALRRKRALFCVCGTSVSCGVYQDQHRAPGGVGQGMLCTGGHRGAVSVTL